MTDQYAIYNSACRGYSRRNMASQEGIMVVESCEHTGHGDPLLKVIQDSRFFVSYNNGNDPTHPSTFENLYEKVGDPVIIDTVEKWNMAYQFGNTFCDGPMPPGKQERRGETTEWIAQGKYDIMWRVRKVKEFRIPYATRAAEMSINIRPRVGRIKKTAAINYIKNL